MTLKPRKIVFWLLALLALAVLAWLGLREPEQMVSAAAVTRGPLEVSFVEEGKTRLKQRYVVTAPVAGTLRRVTLQPGDAVHAGDVLAEIDPATSGLLDPRSRSQAEAEVRAGEAQLAAARERVAAALAAERLAAT
ncbi:MAG: biotin/lipoyl-binding protein, partial [Ottowia sp.]|nr:biotin/lipoyl-binding protein [Ottowia sp.]